MRNPVTKKISVSKPTQHRLTAHIAAAAEHILPRIATLTSLVKFVSSSTRFTLDRSQSLFRNLTDKLARLHLLENLNVCNFFKKIKAEPEL